MNILKSTALLFAIGLLQPVNAQSGTTSEEDPAIDCGLQIVTALSCAGRFCDNVTVTCGGPPRATSAVEHPTRRSDDEGLRSGNRYVQGCFLNERRFGPEPEAFFGGVISGLGCGGHYCDDIFLRCSLLDGFRLAQGAECSWTGWVSDDADASDNRTTSISVPTGFGATAMECRGSNCDDKRLFICPIRAN